MAFIDTDSEDPAGTATFYNLNFAVGHSCPNYEEDVKVIQFFLTRLYSSAALASKKPWGNMVIDGKFGPITRNWIIKTQMICRESGRNVAVDGIIDRAGGPENPSNQTSSISKTMYMIRAINGRLRREDTAVYKSLTTNPVVPPDVQSIFVKIQAEGPAMSYGTE